MINVCILSSQLRCLTNPQESELVSLLKKEIVWVDLEIKEKKDAKILTSIFNFHQLSVADCLDDVHYPKIEQFADYLFVILHTVESLKGVTYKTSEVDFFIQPKCLITVHRGSADTLATIRKHFLMGGLPAAVKPDLLFHVIASKYVDEYFPVLEMLDTEIDTIEDSVFKGKIPTTHGAVGLTGSILQVKKSITGLKRLLTPQRDIFNQLSRNEFIQISKTTAVYFRDIYDRLFRITEMLDSFRDILSSTLEAYLSVVSNKLNEVMKVLTVVTVILLPLTLIAGIYGMNFRYMPELYSVWGYPSALLLMVLVTLSLIWYFKRRHWL
ncbi:MAG: magnesium/cobalt transporter CorA [Patescibacteria group bacterium]